MLLAVNSEGSKDNEKGKSSIIREVTAVSEVALSFTDVGGFQSIYRIFLTDTVSKPYQREKNLSQGEFYEQHF